MLRITLFGTCLLIGLVCSAQANQGPNWFALLQAVWDVGVVDPEKAEIENYLGNDPQSLIELPTETNWIKTVTGPDMSEVVRVIPSWHVLDGSGIRSEMTFSVWCDQGGLFLDPILAYDLAKGEGDAIVEWAFDGEPFVRSIWNQNGRFLLPTDAFPHDTFVRQLTTGKFLVLKIQGHNGLDARPRFRPENTLVVPVSLTSENNALKELIDTCSGSP